MPWWKGVQDAFSPFVYLIEQRTRNSETTPVAAQMCYTYTLIFASGAGHE